METAAWQTRSLSFATQPAKASDILEKVKRARTAPDNR
jgi:hypothetical protein